METKMNILTRENDECGAMLDACASNSNTHTHYGVGPFNQRRMSCSWLMRVSVRYKNS